MNIINSQPKLASLKPPRTHNLSKEDLRTYFDNTWELYELLFSSISSEDSLYLSPDPLRNPLIFYYGHTAAFYINKLRMAGLIKEGVNEGFDHLFAVGVDPNLPENLEVSAYWPSVQEVKEYRKTIYHMVHEVIDQADLSNLPIREDNPLWALMMGLEHDRIHFETSSVLIRQMEVNLVRRPEGWEYAPTLGLPSGSKWIPMAGGSISLGKPVKSDIFGWDNEFGSLKVEVAPFEATQNLITNSEFEAFVKAGGYENRSLWTDEGWNWLTRTDTHHPKFWVAEGDGFRYRAMFDVMEMPLDWPVEVNALEAWAYCAWKNDGSRLLSEAEFLTIAREGCAEDEDPLFCQDHNLDYAYGSPSPVGFMEKGSTASGFHDIYGNVWDWLKDDFYSFPGFNIHPWYPDFSAPYMDKEHSMMAGGAWATTGTGASRYYRLWFRRHFFQHAGFRLARSLD